MTIDLPVAVRRIRLTYADTDAAAILYFAAWFPWMERISVEWVYGRGYRFDQMRARFGTAPAARATSCEYTAPTTVYDEIDVAMRIVHIGTSSYELGFTMTRCSDEVVVARSTLTLVFIGDDDRAAPIPAEYRTMLERARLDATRRHGDSAMSHTTVGPTT
jgi:acyl-CoA thioester hydrolase